MPSCPLPTGNLLLNQLAEADYALVEPHLERATLCVGDQLLAAGAPIDRFCFLEGGVASIESVLADGGRVGVGIIGREGLVGWQRLLGSSHAQDEVAIGVPGGTGLWIGADRLIDAADASPALYGVLLRYIHAFSIQMSRTIVSNLLDPVERRLARWILMNHDRIDGDRVDLTHAQVGVMLGVRRATVTDSLHVLEGNGLVRSTRGCITVRDRAGLRALAGEAYGVAEAEYARSLGPFGKD